MRPRRRRDPDIAKNYYFHGAAIGGKTFAGFIDGKTISYASEWGIKAHVEDLDALISAAIARYPHAAIILGGHSLGGSIVPIYAAWNFGAYSGFERLSGLVLLEGAPNPQGPTEHSQRRTPTSRPASDLRRQPRQRALAAHRRPDRQPEAVRHDAICSLPPRSSACASARWSARRKRRRPDADLIASFFNAAVRTYRVCRQERIVPRWASASTTTTSRCRSRACRWARPSGRSGRTRMPRS